MIVTSPDEAERIARAYMYVTAGPAFVPPAPPNRHERRKARALARRARRGVA